MTVLLASGLRWLPWKNGGGVAADIVAHPAGSTHADAFAWRVGLAEISRDGPFSHYPGYDRLFAIVEGAGVTFDFGAAAPAVTARPRDLVAFQGEWPTGCRLIDGPVIALNLIWARAAWRGAYRIGEAGALGRPAFAPAASVMVALDAAASVDGESLGRFDAVMLDGVPAVATGLVARLDIAPLMAPC